MTMAEEMRAEVVALLRRKLQPLPFSITIDEAADALLLLIERRFFSARGASEDPRPSKTFTRPVPGVRPGCPAINRVLDLAYACDLLAQHRGPHEWRGVPAESAHGCPRCGDLHWVGWGNGPNSGPVKRQCVPCGHVYPHPIEREGDAS